MDVPLQSASKREIAWQVVAEGRRRIFVRSFAPSDLASCVCRQFIIYLVAHAHSCRPTSMATVSWSRILCNVVGAQAFAVVHKGLTLKHSHFLYVTGSFHVCTY